jgi:type IV pilus assembly protein PilQ
MSDRLTTYGRFARLVALLGSLGILCLAETAHAGAVPNHVRDVKMHPTEGVPGSTDIEIVGTTAPVYIVRSEANGKRLFIDLSDSDVIGAPEALTETQGLGLGVQTQAFKTDAGQITRVTINLAKDATYRVRADGNTLRVTLTQVGAVPPPANTPTVAATTLAKPELKEVKFERAPNGKDRVVVSLSDIPAYSLTTTAQAKIRLEMRATKVPDTLLRTLDVTAYHGFLRTVSTYTDAAAGTAIVEIDRNGDAQGDVSVEDGKIIWSFDSPKGNAIASPITKGSSTATRHTVTVAREDDNTNVARVDTSIHDGDNDGTVEHTTGGAEAGFTSGTPMQAAGRYNGRRIDLDLKDADIHNILRLLADVGRVNIVTADDVSGNITIRMRNVPWDQALDVVLQAKSLGMVRQGNLIRVAPLAVLQKERELEIARHKQELDLAPLETRLIPVSYASAEELQARAKDLLSPRGSIAVDERTNVLIARDVTGNLNHVEELVRSLDTQTPQVLIEARIVEATSKYLRDVGIQWGGDTTFSEATGNPTGIAFPSKVGVTGGNYDAQSPTAGLSPFTRQVANPNFAVNLPAAVGTGSGGALGLVFGSADNNINLAVRLSAAESSGMLRIVSSPRILTLDNREARINQGTLIPFSQVSAQGVQTTFQEAKLQLLVKPHVTADGSVAMHVKINRDEPDFNQTSARGDPTILKREAETDLLVMDGHTAVIGGIYTRNTGRNLDQIPFFGDIPLIGILFQRRRASDTRNELVIFLTPRIVNRAEALGLSSSSLWIGSTCRSSPWRQWPRERHSASVQCV